MATPVPDILARIVATKRREVARLREQQEDWEKAAAARSPARDFAAGLAAAPAIIAEIKKASPSKGLLAESFYPAATARAYEQGGAAALSVLTDADFFQGSLAHLREARAACALPVLRKDFTIDPLQILEAAASGADAVLLIAAVLSDRELRDFREQAERRSMAALVEVHDAAELDRAVASGATVIGVNNRNLRTFEVALETSLVLAERFPPAVQVRISESGIRSREDVARLCAAGYGAFLVGETLMRSGDPAGALRDLRG